MDKYNKIYDETRKRIFALLDENGMSQKEFSSVLGVSSQTITDWKKEKSNSFMQKLEQISQALHTTPSWLIGGTGSKHFSEEQRAEFVRQDKQRIELWEKQFQEEILEVYYSTLEKVFAQNGITKSDFYEISQGRNPSQEKVQFISRVFEITPEQLFEIAKNNPVGVQDLQPKKEEKGPAPVSEGEPVYPPEYDLLSPEDQALVDNMIRSLSKKRQTSFTSLHIPPKDKTDSEMAKSDEDIDREVEDYRRRLILEKSQEAGSSPSNGAGSETA